MRISDWSSEVCSSDLFPWGTAAAGFDEQDLRARRSGRDAGTAAIDAMVADLERPASRSADHTRAVFEPVHRGGRSARPTGAIPAARRARGPGAGCLSRGGSGEYSGAGGGEGGECAV